ncbi:VOC family protein [Bacillus testis]|uniref:VOC family protein n=1 Tax=Bacillus testis TaxID=1622072 RepID=UPI00067E77EA|nr:VOC family protein [Bacillus testis]
MIQAIGKITIYVENQAEAKAFWTEKMGFTVKIEQAMGPGTTWLEVGPSDNAFTTLVLYDKQSMMKQNPSTNVGHPTIMFSTKDIEASHKQLQDRGVEVGELMKFPYGSMFSFNDHEGNKFLLREDK